MQIKEIINEGDTWNKFLAARAARQGSPKQSSVSWADAFRSPLQTAFTKYYNWRAQGAEKGQQAKKAADEQDRQAKSTSLIARKAREAWQMQLKEYVKNNNNQPLSRLDYSKLLSSFIYKVTKVNIHPMQIHKDIPDQNVTRVEDYFANTVLPQQQAIAQQQAAAAQQQAMKNVGRVDPATGIPYGSKVKINVLLNPNSLRPSPMEYTLQSNGMWKDTNNKLVDPNGNPNLHNAIINGYRKVNKIPSVAP